MTTSSGGNIRSGQWSEVLVLNASRKKYLLRLLRLLCGLSSLTRPYNGLTLNDCGDFVNFVFARA